MKEYRFVIWGAGTRKDEILEYLPVEWIAAIIDSNPQRIGDVSKGIEVVDLRTYLNKFNMYPVVITPKGYESSIKKELSDFGIMWAFEYWGQNRENMISLMRQVPREWLEKDLKKHEPVIIYGWNFLTIILCNLCEEIGIPYSVLLPRDLNDAEKHFVSELYKLPLCENVRDGSGIILAQDLNDADASYKSQIVGRYHELTRDTELFYNPKLERFRNIHRGERCFVVACGPSLNFQDLELLDDMKEICISMNRVYKGYKHTKWRPDYYIAVDRRAIADYGTTRGLAKKASFIADMIWDLIDTSDKNVYKWHQYNYWEENTKFSEDFSHGSYWGYTVNYDAVQLAVFMGFDEIYIIGADCCNYSDPKQMHFVKDYLAKPASLFEDKIVHSFASVKRYADEHGIRICNATRGGKLDSIDRIDFDSLFEKR